jgi:hypothetical protein
MRTQILPLFIGVIVIVFIIFVLTKKNKVEHFKLPDGSYKKDCKCERELVNNGNTLNCANCGYSYDFLKKRHSLTCQCNPSYKDTTVSWNSGSCSDIQNIGGNLTCITKKK